MGQQRSDEVLALPHKCAKCVAQAAEDGAGIGLDALTYSPRAKRYADERKDARRIHCTQQACLMQTHALDECDGRCRERRHLYDERRKAQHQRRKAPARSAARAERRMLQQQCCHMQ